MLKQEIRSSILNKRRFLSKAEVVQLSTRILNRLQEKFDFNDKKVSVFLPIEKFIEVDTRPLLALNNLKIGLPIVQEEGQMKHIIYESESQLEVSDWGIPEPTYGKEVQADYFDIILVPLLTIDKRGYRVGYGKGFYDRFLANCKTECKFIGLSFFEPIQEIEDLNEYDKKLHYCVTPDNIHEF